MKGPYPADVFDIPYTSVSSFVLLASSLTMVLALAAIQRGDVARMRVWLLATALLGMTFIGGQVYEFTTFYREGLTLTTNVFGTYVLRADRLPRDARDGRHPDAAHARRARRGGIAARRAAVTVELVGLYWHFVDIVWIVIFTVVYLIPTGSPEWGLGRPWPNAATSRRPRCRCPRARRHGTRGRRSTSGSRSSWRRSRRLEVAIYYIDGIHRGPDPAAVLPVVRSSSPSSCCGSCT